jgi:hypothetical protein
MSFDNICWVMGGQYLFNCSPFVVELIILGEICIIIELLDCFFELYVLFEISELGELDGDGLQAFESLLGDVL